ncbi:hypothetical protein OPV22_001632 [Ensete ventricosum]|uniref:Uncharacterized protein n=1 Tax=Ensete ventricosum TaxID=4639 RepID=A0AAV8RWD2_ENSVE|nr:hypothetical protein OPV22_001632 [Ensete ventricosum]
MYRQNRPFTLSRNHRSSNGALSVLDPSESTATSLEEQEVRSLTHDINDTLDRDIKVLPNWMIYVIWEFWISGSKHPLFYERKLQGKVLA